MRKRTGLWYALVGTVLIAAVAAAQYSYFGENKVQTRDYQFQNFETEHFRVLFYPGGEGLAEFAGRSAEEYYSQTSKDLGVEVEGKVPLIMYLAPGQFGETNVVLDVLDEGVGGFSELIKNRIVVPFDGSYYDLHHVIGHELTHIFEFQMYYRSKLASLLGAIDEFSVPLWVLEGFAEFQSGWVNVSSDDFTRDLVINNRLVPLQDLSDGMGYLVYREGESFFRYVEEKYGRKKVYEFMLALRSKRKLDGAFASVFGVAIKRFSSDWEKYLQMKYWPQVVKLDNFERLAKRLTNHVDDGSIYNTAPAISPSGTKIVMISDRSEYTDVYVVSAFDGRVLKRLVKGERSGGFESVHLVRPGVAWSPDEKTIAVVATSAGRDNVTLIDYETGRIRRRIYGNLDGIYSPRFSPDGKQIVFVGLKNGFSDIYTAEADRGEPRRVTYDMYDDRDPVFSPGGDTIAFVSDRPDQGEVWMPGRYAVWLRDQEGSIARLTDRGGQLSHPVFSHGGQYLLYAASDSASNIYAYSLVTNRIVRRTDFLGDVSYLTLSRDDRKLAFAYFHNVGWDVAVMLDPLENLPADSGKPYQPPLDTFAFEKAGLDFSKVRPVGFNPSLDYAAAAASYGTGSSGGFAGTVDVAVSDMLGDHRFELYTDLYGNILNSDIILQYWHLPRRIDYGFTLFQLQDVRRYNPYHILEWDINRGVQALGVYPFNRFVRVEAGPAGYYSEVERDTWVDPPEVSESGWYQDSLWHELVFDGEVALVFDNTYSDANGPARGTRARIGADASLLSTRRSQDVFLDVRNYQRLGRRFVCASQLLGVRSFGADADRYYLGGIRFLEYAPGQVVVRGYQPAEFYYDYGPAAVAFSFELRYPFIDRVKLAFPLPIEFGGIRGVAFLDGGVVAPWGTGRDFHLWDASKGTFDNLKLGAGFGARVSISYFLLKFDFAKPLSTTDDSGWKFILGLGTDF
ncbi:MAG: BamA/TamA family outer membrane protein [candidate division WOR-3 bacterium]|nr:BamA/TamA family outer membrane protein [candidate division WOR-3 bacterium]